MMYSKTSSPICSTVFSPEMIGPQSMSIISGSFTASLVLVDNFTMGLIGLPVGVPKPVVNN